MIKSFPFYKQQDAMDCGPTCLRMIANYYGKHYSLKSLQQKTGYSKEGVSLFGISEAAESIGLKSLGVKTTLEKLLHEAPLPCLVHWKQNHFVVVYRITKNKVYIADPAKGLITYNHEEFCQHWQSTQENNQRQGIALLVEPTLKFYQAEDEKTSTIGFGQLLRYLLGYKKLIFQLGLGLFTGSVLQLIFPFLTQSIVDVGIATQNLNFIYLVLAAQLMLFVGRISVEFIRSWILLHISTRVNISILSDFFIKLMRLPLSFFDVKMYGDIIQRIGDHHRIEQFLTGQSLNTLFSLVNLVVFSGVLAYYYPPIFFIFLVASLLYAGWVVLFLKKRRQLNFKQFDISSKNQSSIVQLIQGMQDIKLANAERQKRWDWEHLQAKLFRFSIKSLALNQTQQAGALVLNEGKNIFITFLAARAVVEGQMTLGAMLAVQYIIGQLNGPIEQLITFLQTWQDAQISLERLNEIHERQDEEPADKPLLDHLPQTRSLIVKDLSFAYTAGSDAVLKNLNFYIPEGETTAIVGMSGSGKTTLLKLLLKFYDPTTGNISFARSDHSLDYSSGQKNYLSTTNNWTEAVSLKHVSHKLWRSHCGVVMQEGFIFSDTIAHNIAVGEDKMDVQKLLHAVKVANIQEFIESLPLGYNTKIGAEGNGISQGQKQRILIARAVYKNPEFIFFDEATNALDATNERIIMDNLDTFFRGRTVVIVAHRLSTVRNADQIIVLHKGEIVEVGTHSELVSSQGHYYTLVKNQLELGE